MHRGLSPDGLFRAPINTEQTPNAPLGQDPVNLLFLPLDGINGTNPGADAAARTPIFHNLNARKGLAPYLDSLGGTAGNAEPADPTPFMAVSTGKLTRCSTSRGV